jgi:hypothetical protein
MGTYSRREGISDTGPSCQSARAMMVVNDKNALDNKEKKEKKTLTMIPSDLGTISDLGREAVVGSPGETSLASGLDAVDGR